jgi:hypothetical protein
MTLIRKTCGCRRDPVHSARRSFAESQFGPENVIVCGHQQNERIGRWFRNEVAQTITELRHGPEGLE